MIFSFSGVMAEILLQDSIWHPFYNEHGDISEVCLTTVLGSSGDKFYRKLTIDKLEALY